METEHSLSGDQIRQLRRRMGWSLSDLARRLSCESSSVESWETGKAQPTDAASQRLQLLFNQAEMAAYEITQNVELEKRQLDENIESMHRPEKED